MDLNLIPIDKNQNILFLLLKNEFLLFCCAVEKKQYFHL